MDDRYIDLEQNYVKQSEYIFRHCWKLYIIGHFFRTYKILVARKKIRYFQPRIYELRTFIDALEDFGDSQP